MILIYLLNKVLYTFFFFALLEPFTNDLDVNGASLGIINGGSWDH